MAHILFLTAQLPYPPHQGTSLRNFHIIRGLADAHRITLLTFIEANQSAASADIAPLIALCDGIETVPVPERTTAQRLRQLLTTRLPDMAHRLYSPQFEAALQRLLQQHAFDVVQVEGIELARVMPLIRSASPHSCILFDDHNAEAELQRRNFLTDLPNPRRWLAAAYSWLQIGRLRRFERWACQMADWITAVSETDKVHLQRLTNQPLSITVIPNCIDVHDYRQLPVEAGLVYDLVFSGKMDYRPNVDAVLWFAQQVWPLIKKERPSTTWAIVGQKPHDRLTPLQQLAGVTVTGWVDAVQPYLAGASLYIMPFRIGSGTRLKLIEAMAAGKTIVSTPIGAEGFPVVHQAHLWLAEGAEGMKTAVLQLLDDPEQRRVMGQAAQAFALQYDWRVVIPQFNALYESKLNE